jgi:hypothetical protein
VPNIREWYEARKGTANGLPFLHMSINIAPYYEAECDREINYFGLETVMNDYNANALRGRVETNAVHDLFDVPFNKPRFIVLNCTTNSSYNPPYQLVLSQDAGLGDFSSNGPMVTGWHNAIDGVQGPVPQITNLRFGNGAVQFNFLGQRGRTNQVQCTSNLLNWIVLTNVTGTNLQILFRDTNIVSQPGRIYRLRRL